MNKEELIKFAGMPLNQLPNRVWRTYKGGAMIDQWKNTHGGGSDSLPEEWIMSTITARGKNRPEEEGLSFVKTPLGVVSLKELINSNLELFLGKRVSAKFGTTGLLIKMLDANERLTIQVHPDKTYSQEILHSPFGKTESWYILDSQEIEGEKSYIYLGFKENISREIWAELFRTQDIQGMLNCLHRFEVHPGDAFIIYGGVPHAIGSGCFLMEVQEPTDYTMRVEKVTPGGLTISDELIHQGVGEENMLQCFHYDGCSFQEAIKKWKILPEIIASSDAYTLKTIFNENHTDCFGLNELELDGEFIFKGNGSFFVGVIHYGEGTITCRGNAYSFSQGDEIFFPAAIETITFKSTIKTKILLCFPPR